MPVLTILADPSAPPEAREVDGGWRVTAPAQPVLSNEDSEDIRWYFEDYLSFPDDPAPRIARRVEQTLRAVGERLFRSIFDDSPQRQAIWSDVNRQLAVTSIEIRGAAGVSETIPFELMRAPGDEMPLATTAYALTRATDKPTRVSVVEGLPPLRVLLVICRPGGEIDVPFRSVGGEIVRESDLLSRGLVTVDVLRPPRTDRLESALLQAKTAGRPYHIVHLDAHGVFGDLDGRGVPRGYIQFENPGSLSNKGHADGSILGRWLVAGGVPVVIINACRSAYAQALPASGAPTQARTYGSLAREIANAGVPGVVAMRYNVYVPTAARAVGGLYAHLANGLSLGEAVRWVRTDLAARPERSVGFGTHSLQDWSVPVVLEAAPVRLCSPPPDKYFSATVARVDRAAGQKSFIGRDDALLSLDRGFDGSDSILLVGQLGSGKSSTALEFGRWYRRTGGCAAVHHASVRDSDPDAFLRRLENELGGDASRPALLWILDDIDHVDGYPVRLISTWKGRHRNRLRNWLRRAIAANIKVLLVGRRVRQDWPGARPPMLRLRPLPSDEAAEILVQSARAESVVLDGALDGNALVAAAMGNPGMLHLLSRSVIREVAKGGGGSGAILEGLLAGELPFSDDDPLPAGVAQALIRDPAGKDHRVLSVLHLFRGPASSADLQVMGMADLAWRLEELKEVGENPRLADAVMKQIEDRGLAGEIAPTWYDLHPALPAALRDLFHRDYPGERSALAERAYVCAFADFANHLANFIIGGTNKPLHALGRHQPNILRAWHIAVVRGWIDQAIHLMQGLEELLRSQNRLRDFKSMVDVVEPLVSTSSGPKPPWSEEWRFIQEYKARLAASERSFYTEPEREAALAALTAVPPDPNSPTQIRTHAVGLNEQGVHLLQCGDVAGLDLIQQSIDIARRINDSSMLHVGLLQMASAYTQFDEIRDYEKAATLLEEAIAAARKSGQDRQRLDALLGLAETLIEEVKTLTTQKVSGRALTPQMKRIADTLGEAKPLIDASGSFELAARQATAVAESMLLDWQYEAAIKAFSTAARLSPHDPIRAAKCMMMIGFCCKRLNRHEAAREYFESAKALTDRHGLEFDVKGENEP